MWVRPEQQSPCSSSSSSSFQLHIFMVSIKSRTSATSSRFTPVSDLLLFLCPSFLFLLNPCSSEVLLRSSSPSSHWAAQKGWGVGACERGRSLITDGCLRGRRWHWPWGRGVGVKRRIEKRGQKWGKQTKEGSSFYVVDIHKATPSFMLFLMEYKIYFEFLKYDK